MSNWCDNGCAVFGSKAEVENFHQKLLAAEKFSCAEKKWGTYSLFLQFGFDENYIFGPDSGYIRGNFISIDDVIQYKDDIYMIVFYFETAWDPMIPGINKLLSRFYKTLSAVFRAEECGNCIYINTDSEGKVFDDKYCIYDDEYGTEYFSDDESLIKYIKDSYNYDLTSVSSLRDSDVIKKGKKKLCDFYRYCSY